MRVWNSVWLAVEAYHLLARGVGLTCKNAGLRHGGVTLVLEDAAQWDAPLAKGFEQQAAGFVVADKAHWQHVHAEGREVVNRIRTSARNNRPLAMFEDEDR